ncbi:SEA domain-containing protein [Aphelenchoides bicaudatus]|nr:SEA domain-containing protein [Aphelenchoides bicaudatus]
MTYIIPLIVISALLLIFLIAIILLFATGVFQFRKATPPPKPANPLDYVTERPAQDHLINRTFECEIFIKYQANAAYNDPTSIEYDQASLIIRNALNTLISQSTIRDLTPRIALERLQNQGNDLRVPFRMTLLLLSNSRLTADSIQNVLLSELSLLEIQLNNTEIDRSRVHVRLVE